MMMVRWMCRTSLQDGARNEDLKYMGLSGIAEEIRYDKPRLYWLVARRDESHWLRTPTGYMMADLANTGKRHWQKARQGTKH